MKRFFTLLCALTLACAAEAKTVEAGFSVSRCMRRAVLSETSFTPEGQARFRVECSKGTYVRSLGRDLAEKLGTCGFLQELRRTKCGQFGLESKILLENIKNIVHSNALKEILLPLETSLRDIAEIAVSEVDADKLKKGQGVSPRAYDIDKLIGREAAAFCNGSLIAIVRIEEKRISPLRVFNL